ncbi:uncharacterized protein LOC108742512, partial [Agrilus planipennis]|uniref:Uncharacterized protein LOC108742512 n=1 Tax=Agrilus planipennis TaxID=224129 RepID=A0A1W4XLA8_AGRPL
MCPTRPVAVPLLLFFTVLQTFTFAANLPSSPLNSHQEIITDVRVDCNSDEIVVKVFTDSGRFNGMIYPRGLSKNSSCFIEWAQKPSPVQYVLPLRACNTMSTEL